VIGCWLTVDIRVDVCVSVLADVGPTVVGRHRPRKPETAAAATTTEQVRSTRRHIMITRCRRQISTLDFSNSLPLSICSRQTHTVHDLQTHTDTHTDTHARARVNTHAHTLLFYCLGWVALATSITDTPSLKSMFTRLDSRCC